MTVALLVITDGRDEYLDRCVGQSTSPLIGYNAAVTEWWMHDDTGDDEYRAGLRRRFPDFAQLGEGPRRGFGGAIGHAWSRLLERSDAEFVFHLEADFLFSRPVDLIEILRVLSERPHLAQMALRRQPWNPDEWAAGGIVEQHPDDYTEVTDGRATWLEHRRFWTTNPSLYRRSLCARGWPAGPQSEGRFGLRLFEEDPAARSGFWGARTSGEWCEHIGHARAGTGY